MSKETLHPSEDVPASTAQRRRFRIELRGQVDLLWTAALDPLSVTNTDNTTILDVLVDQAGLRGTLNRLWDLNLDILSVVEITGKDVQKGEI